LCSSDQTRLVYTDIHRMLILLGLSLHASHSSRLKKAGVGLAPSVSRVSGSRIAKEQLAEGEREDQGSARSGEGAFRDLRGE
jgi:hypothetical protein